MIVPHVLGLFCYVIIIQVIFATATPDLFVPKAIHAFSYDVSVQVNNATIGEVVELFANNQSEAITAQIITKTSQTSTLIFNCGYFLQTGDYYFKLRSNDKIIATSSPVTATKWPEVALKWKKEHTALTTDVEVSLSLEGRICKSAIARQNNLSLRLKRLNQGTADIHSVESVSYPLHPSTETFIPSYFILPCEEFQNVGDYQVELIMTSSGLNDITIATSDVMNVGWSNGYDLKISKNAFPCQGSGVDVSLSFPPCASPDDYIELLSVMNGSMQVIDTKRRKDQDHVTFPCSAFYNVNQTVEGFCIRYVVKTGHVTRTICEPANRNAGFQMDGDWSPWSSWATCDRPCQRNTNRRKRQCNNPRPQGQGARCKDKNGEEKLEDLEYKEGKRQPSCELDAIVTSHKEKCECGCFLPMTERGIVMSSLTNDCEGSRTVIWRVRVPKGHVIRFQVTDYQLASDEILTVRDGMTSWPLTSQYPSVTSQNSIVMIQWVKSKINNNLNSCGFVLSYEAMTKPTLKTWPSTVTKTTNSSLNLDSDGLADVSKWFEHMIVDNPVVIGGIAACGLIILIVVAVVVIHCRRKKKSKIPAVCHTPMNARLAMPPDGRSCSNDDTESEPMVRPRPLGDSTNLELMQDTCIPVQNNMNTGTAYYLAQRQLELMKRLGKDEHSQTYATGCLSETNLRQQEELLFGDRQSLHKNEELRVS